MRIALMTLAALLVSGCATLAGPAGPPSLAVDPGQPAPAQARFYADCIADAARAGTYDRVDDTLRFRCGGAIAEAFYNALGPWSAQIGSEHSSDGRTMRFTARLEDDTAGADFCWRDADAFGCTVVLSVGAYLAAD